MKYLGPNPTRDMKTYIDRKMPQPQKLKNTQVKWRNIPYSWFGVHNIIKADQ